MVITSKDRYYETMFTIEFDPQSRPTTDDICFIFNGKNEVLIDPQNSFGFLTINDLLGIRKTSGFSPKTEPEYIYLGKWAGQIPSETRSVWLVRDIGIDSHVEYLNGKYIWNMLRPLIASATNEVLVASFRALHIHGWLNRFKLCSQCGSGLVFSKHELALECGHCSISYYPVISPAIIVAITRNNGSELLLAQAKNHTANWHSLIAGYCEAGEAIEQTVVREVFEETGLRVKDIVYRESQSWPFSQSLMLGFTAEYASGDLCVDTNELDNAAWYPVGNLPETPPAPSIASKLITLVKAEYKKRATDI